MIDPGEQKGNPGGMATENAELPANSKRHALQVEREAANVMDAPAAAAPAIARKTRPAAKKAPTKKRTVTMPAKESTKKTPAKKSAKKAPAKKSAKKAKPKTKARSGKSGLAKKANKGAGKVSGKRAR